MHYSIAYAASWAVFVIAIICGALFGADKLGMHPGWLTPDVASTAGVIGVICAPIAAALPQIQRTPAARATAYQLAAHGLLPKDVPAEPPSTA